MTPIAIAAPRPQNARAGLLLATLAVSIFAAQDGISKHLATHYPPIFVTMLRYWFFAIFVVLWASRRKGGLRAVAATSQPVLQMARGALLALQIVVAITAFAMAGLANSLAVFAATPLAIAALSVPVLGEAVGWRRWTAIAVGFAGVMIILRPGPELLDSNVWIAAVAMVGFSFYSVLTRYVAQRDEAATSFFYTGIGGVVVLTAIGPFYWTNMTPPDWVWMAVLCVSGTAGHYFLIRAYEAVAAVVIQPVTYLQIVLGTITGVVIFGETLEPAVVVGGIVVISAGLFAAWREAVRARQLR